MWHLYLVASLLAAGVAVRLVSTLMDRGRHRHGGGASAADGKLAVFICLFVPLGALSLYLPLGRPDLPGAPALFAAPEESLLRQQALLKQRPFQVLLGENPDDLGALVQLAVISVRLGELDEAVKFYQRAVAVAQQTNDVLLRVYAVSLGEVQVMAAKGRVGDDAVGTFEYVRTIYPGSPIARHYLALARAQRGQKAEAVAEWEKLLSDGPPGAYWKEQVRNALSRARAEMRKEGEKRGGAAR